MKIFGMLIILMPLAILLGIGCAAFIHFNQTGSMGFALRDAKIYSIAFYVIAVIVVILQLLFAKFGGR